jgi:hypothetical protein
MQVKKSVEFKVPVRMFDSITGLGKTGLVFGGVTVYLQKQAGSSTVKTMVSGDLTEIDATNMPGVYDLKLSASDTDTVGYLKFSVAASGCETFIGVEEVVAAFAYDVLKIEKNRWKIDTSTNQLTVYDDNGTSALYVFNLKDNTGAASATKVYERVPV